jgi:hypothetical protein
MSSFSNLHVLQQTPEQNWTSEKIIEFTLHWASKSKSYYDRRFSRPVCLGIKHTSGAYNQIFITVRQLRVCWWGALSLTRGRVCLLQLLLALASAVTLESESHFTVSDSRLPWTERSHVPSLYNFGKNRIEITTSNSSCITVCSFVAAEAFVDSPATVWFPWTRLLNTQRWFVSTNHISVATFLRIRLLETPTCHNILNNNLFKSTDNKSCIYIFFSFVACHRGEHCSLNNQPTPWIRVLFAWVPVSPWHGASSGFGWRRRPPDMEGSYKYTIRSKVSGHPSVVVNWSLDATTTKLTGIKWGRKLCVAHY